MKLNRILAGVAFVVAGAALASVSVFNGVGFVGKGDVQTAFGWNNPTIQKNAPGVTFTYESKDVYDVECYWETLTGNGKIIIHDLTIPKHTSINSAVAYDARTHKQVDGFNLKGYTDVVIDGVVPVVGAPCPGNNPGYIINVALISSSGGLFVNYGDKHVPLPNTPTL